MSQGSRLRPLGTSDVDIADGFWGDRLKLNRQRTIPHGFEQLQHSGALGNLRLAGGAPGEYKASSDDGGVTLPLILATSRTETSLGGTDWGMLQAGVTISIIPCVLVYLLLQRYYMAGLMSGAVK